VSLPKRRPWAARSRLPVIKQRPFSCRDRDTKVGAGSACPPETGLPAEGGFLLLLCVVTPSLRCQLQCSRPNRLHRRDGAKDAENTREAARLRPWGDAKDGNKPEVKDENQTIACGDDILGTEIPARLRRKGPRIPHGFEAFMDFQATESSMLGSIDRLQSLGALNPWAK